MSCPEPVILHPSTVPAEYVKEGADWLSVFSPYVQRVMDVKLHGRISCHTVIGSVRFSPDGSCIAIGFDGGVAICNLDGTSKTTFPLVDEQHAATRNRVRGVAFSPKSTLLAAASEDKLVRVWELSSKSLLYTFSLHTREVYALEFTPDGQRLLSASGDRTIRIWSLYPSPAEHAILTVISDSARSDTGITALSVSPDGHYVAVGSVCGLMRVWNLQTGEHIIEWKAHGDQIYSIRWTHAGLVSGGLDKVMKKWSVELAESRAARCERIFPHENYVLSTATARHGHMERAATGSVDGKFQMWDLKSGELLFCIIGHRNSVTSVDLSPDGAYAASGSGDGDVRIWAYTVI